MRREEYMGALKSALAGVDEELVQEIVNDYEERFRVGLEKGKTEEQVIQELGSIKDLVDELGEMQQGAGNAGAFKASGTVEDDKTKTEDATREENRQSGTFYQEKSFAETFDSAMKKFGKVMDTVMKEAGKAIEDVAEQIEIHFEKAKNKQYYTANNETYYEGSEKDMDGEPNVEQSGEGTEGCRRVILDADLADVKVYSAKDAKPRAVCRFYSHKTAMMYPFYTKQEGDTFYVGIRRNQDTEKKSGFFRVTMSPSIDIEMYLPEGIILLEAGSTSGEMELNEIAPKELALHTKSGGVYAKHLICDRINIGTASGKVNMKNVQAAKVEVGTASGDVYADNFQSVNAKFHTASGEIKVNNCYGETLEANTASGDVSVKAEYKKYTLNTQSGEINVENRQDADVCANSMSGNVYINIAEAMETYAVNMHSMSGDCSTEGHTKSSGTMPTKNIEARTMSGDINVRFL